jgi:hypothetical protein
MPPFSTINFDPYGSKRKVNLIVNNDYLRDEDLLELQKRPGWLAATIHEGLRLKRRCSPISN